LRTGLAVSSIGHAVVLGWGLIAFAPAVFETPPTEAMPVDLVPISEFTQLQKGNKNAPKQEQAKQAAEKIAEAKQAPEKEHKPKEPEVKTAAAPPSPPPPPPEPTPPPQAKKEESKPEPKPAEVATPLPPKKLPPKPKTPDVAKQDTPQQKQRDFNPDKIAALLDRRQPNTQRAAEQPSQTAALGASMGNAPRLSQSEIDALRAQIQACWNPPVGAENAQDLIVHVRVKFRIDGTLSAEPEVLNRGSSPYFRVAVESAMRAVRRCQPYTLPAHKYEIWRDVEVAFDPKDMFGR